MQNLTSTGWLIGIIVGLLVGWLLYLTFIKPYLRNKEFRAWRDRPHIKHALQVLSQLYDNVDSLGIARKACQQPEFREYAFIYGEIDIISFIAILEAAQPKAGDIFYDLGAGAGKAVFTAALAFEFAACRGIELVPELHQLSNQLLKQTPELHNRVEFVQADFLTIDLSEANLIFINAACFLGETWHALLAQLKQLKPGTKIILASKQLPEPEFCLLNEALRYMSWGTANVRIYTKSMPE